MADKPAGDIDPLLLAAGEGGGRQLHSGSGGLSAPAGFCLLLASPSGVPSAMRVRACQWRGPGRPKKPADAA